MTKWRATFLRIRLSVIPYSFPQMRSLLRFLALTAILLPATLRAEIQHVIAISVDGLRGDFLQSFIDSAPATFPNLVRLRNASAYTYNARCDYDYSETVPNHLAMVTGRPVLLPGGLPTSAFTGFTNNFPTATDTVHVYGVASGTNSGPYKAGVFDVVHDAGLSTALYLGKTRLEIIRRSYNATNGAPDATGADNGRNKIDFSQVQDGNTGTLISTLASHIAGTLERFTFLHITDPDTAGHGFGWTTTVGGAYRNSIITLDTYLGSIYTALDANAALAGKVAILLTGDHGGGGLAGAPTSHLDATQPGNFTIPFFLSAPGLPGGSDLYSAFDNRFTPAATARPAFTAASQPVHNADLANLSTALLGLPLVTNAFIQPELKRPLTLTRAGSTMTAAWPSYLTGYTLEYTDDLIAGPWTTVTSGITEAAGQKTYSFSYPPPDRRYFRLRKP